MSEDFHATRIEEMQRLVVSLEEKNERLAKALTQVRELIGRQFGPQYVPEKPNFFAAGERAQEAHEAIRPTDVTRRPEDVRDALSDEQFRLYQLIWSRFVACQMPPAV